MSHSRLPLVFGAAALGDDGLFNTSVAVDTLLETLLKADVRNIDTAALYGYSERLLGEAHASQKFFIDTKTTGGFIPGHGAKDVIISEAKNSQNLLRSTMDVFYLHAPDGPAPLEITLEGVHEVHKSGFFSRFGLSNFQAAEVKDVWRICKEKGYPLPQVYEGNYSAVTRRQEEFLFPTLRRLDIAFYAYCPAAGGLLAKSKQDALEGIGRFNTQTNIGKGYTSMYAKPAYLNALQDWERMANEEDASRGGKVVFGGRTLDHIERTVSFLRAGPLSENACAAIDQIWEPIKHEAPLDNFNRNTYMGIGALSLTWARLLDNSIYHWQRRVPCSYLREDLIRVSRTSDLCLEKMVFQKRAL